MNRRSFLLAIPTLVVSADLEGTRRKRRADARCRFLGRVFASRGYSAHELAIMDRDHCQLVNEEWKSSRVFTA